MRWNAFALRYVWPMVLLLSVYCFGQFGENDMLTNDNQTRLAQESAIAKADDMAECNLPMTLEDEDRAYIAIQNRRRISELLAKRGIPVPPQLTFAIG